MASRKEYEMLFRLNAEMGGGYTATFGKASSTITSLQRDIQALNKQQSDINAYQKQQQAVESTKQKMELLQQQYDNIQREIQETGGYSSELENRLLSKQQQIDRTAQSLQGQTQKLEEMGAALRSAGVDTDNLERESADLSSKLTDLKRKQTEVADGAKDFGASQVKAFEEVKGAIAAAGIAVALKEIGSAYMECVKIAGDFEETMSTVEALSGATADEMTTLGEKAKQLGATTKFTAQEAAEAMTYMGMAGWDAQQMVAGMDGVLNLAAAAGEDLALTSDIVTDNLTAFGMAASETGRFADVLAAAATNSNTSVSVMGETFKNSAAIAGTLGYSIEDVAVATGLMANAGIKGSTAGTALKNTFNGLLAGVTITGKALGEYEFTAVRADGTMKSFSDTIEELRTVFDQLSDAEKVQNAQAIAGQRTYTGLLAILNATNEDYAKLSNSINNCTGAAQRMVAVKLDNMNGQLTLMNSAYDALKTTLGEQFTPVMRELYKVGADVFGVLNDFVQKHPGLVKAIAAFIAVLGGVALALGAYSVAAKVAAAASTLLAASIPGLNIILGVTAVVAGLTAAIVGFVSAMDDGIPTVEELTTAAADMQKTLDEARTAYSDIATETEAAASIADQYITRLEEMEREYGDAASEQLEYHNVLALLCQTVPELADYIDLTNNTIEGGTEALRRNTEEWRKNAMAQAYQEQLTKMYAAQAQVMLEYEQNSIKLTAAETKRTAAEKRQAAIMQEMADMEKEWADQLYAANEVVTAGELGAVRHTEAYQALVAELEKVSMEQAEADKTAINLSKAMETDAAAVEKAKEELALAQQAIDNLTGSTQASVEVQREAEQQTQRVNDAINNTLTQVLALTEAYDKAYEAA